MGSGLTDLKMKTIILVSFLATAALAAPEARFSCSECVDEMHKLGWMVKMGAVPIHDYVSANYCPTLGEEQGWCEEALSRYYGGMLYAVVEHYFVDGAVHVVRLEEPATLLRSTPVTSASRAWNGSRLTLRTRS